MQIIDNSSYLAGSQLIARVDNYFVTMNAAEIYTTGARIAIASLGPFNVKKIEVTFSPAEFCRVKIMLIRLIFDGFTSRLLQLAPERTQVHRLANCYIAYIALIVRRYVESDFALYTQIARYLPFLAIYMDDETRVMYHAQCRIFGMDGPASISLTFETIDNNVLVMPKFDYGELNSMPALFDDAEFQDKMRECLN